MLHNDQSAHQEFATQSSPAFLIGTAQLNLEPSFSRYYDPVLGPWPFLGIVTTDAIFAADPQSFAPTPVRAVLPTENRHRLTPTRWARRARVGHGGGRSTKLTPSAGCAGVTRVRAPGSASADPDHLQGGQVEARVAAMVSGVTCSGKALVSQCVAEAPSGVTFRQKVLQYQRTA